MRYTVKRCFYPYGKNATNRKEMKLFLDGKFPAIEINRHLVLAQIDKEKPLGTPIYYLCIYLNYLDENGLNIPKKNVLNYILRNRGGVMKRSLTINAI